MIRLFGLIWLALAATSCATSAPTQKVAAFDAAALEFKWNRAHIESDVQALDSIWSDRISIVVPGMAPLQKADALAMWSSVPVKFSQYDSHIDRVMIEGGSAVVTGTIDRERVFGTRAAKESWLFTKVYFLEDKRWRVISFHASAAADLAGK